MADAFDTSAPVSPEMLAHYSTGYESQRLQESASQIERVRTQEIISRYIPRPPAIVFDIGGGPGVYSFWLAQQGYALLEKADDLLEPLFLAAIASGDREHMARLAQKMPRGFYQTELLTASATKRAP